MNYIPDKKIGGKTDFRNYLAIAYVKTIYRERERLRQDYACCPKL